MIEKAEKDGLITPGKTTLVDFTSGNTGIGEAMVCAAKGYKCIIVMPQVPPMFERYIICRQFGAEVRLLNPAAGGVAWVNYTKELAAQPDHWYIGQMENESNPAAHIEHTGPEIWAQAGGQVDYFVHGIGTGGCVEGVGKSPSELSDAPRGVVDEWGHVTTAECVEWATKVTQAEGMMVGPSAGAAIKYACDVACRPEAAGKTIVVVVPSHGIRYVQHPLWGKMKAEVCYPSYHPATTCSTNCGRCRAASPADFFTYS